MVNGCGVAENQVVYLEGADARSGQAGLHRMHRQRAQWGVTQ